MKQVILILIVMHFAMINASVAQTPGDVCTDPFIIVLEDRTLFTFDLKQISNLDLTTITTMHFLVILAAAMGATTMIYG